MDIEQYKNKTEEKKPNQNIREGDNMYCTVGLD